MAQRSLYEVLMLHPSADTDIVSTVYRRLAKRYHPDRDSSVGAQQRMTELNAAYEASLRDPVARARYDASLAAEPARPTSDGGAPVQRDAGPPSAAPSNAPYGEAGPPPPGTGGGPALTFGRYRGWTLAQIARVDRDFLEWLDRSPAGRAFRDELARLLRVRKRDR